MREKIYEGSKVPLNISLNRFGSFSMAQYDFTIYYYCSKDKVIEVKKGDATKVNDDNYMFIADTSLTGRGKLRCAVLAYVPDTNLPELIRPEIIDDIDSGYDVVETVVKL